MNIEQQLLDAKNAYHQLLIGHAVVSLFVEGKRIEYQTANKSNLERYIRELEMQIVSNGRYQQRLPPARVG